MERHITAHESDIIIAIEKEKTKLIKDIKSVPFMGNSPLDVSYYPRIITRKQHTLLEKICKKITMAAIEEVVERNNDKKSEYQITKELELTHPIIQGIGRYDFLEENDEIKLVELNYSCVGGFRGIMLSEKMLSLVPCVEEKYEVISPSQKLASIIDGSIKNILFIGSEVSCPSEEINTQYLIRSFANNNLIRITEKDLDKVKFNGAVTVGNDEIHGVYFRNFSYEDEFNNAKEFCKNIYLANISIFDSIVLVHAEDKDLRFLTKRDSTLESNVTKIVDPTPEIRIADYVVKSKYEHGGFGVHMNTTSFDPIKEILQERIYANKIFVKTINGQEGFATHDLAVYVAYQYNTQFKIMDSFEIAGYLTRGSLSSEIVNLCQNGIIIPTFIEK
ncbi:MAG: hypothetical protein ACP5NV_05280 [Candidatus Woesearchaeota archaeon]